tara:strand:- start:983 stop:1369 length:387 start_codon:yes stop_codon:yes gene_type:complete
MKIYCPDCGNKLEYTVKKPNFCVNCGYKFAGAQVEHTAPVPDEQYAEEESKVSDFDQLGGLLVDIDVAKPQGVKFGDVCGIASQDNGTKAGEVYSRPSDGASKEEVLQKLRQEGSTARGGSKPPSKKV